MTEESLSHWLTAAIKSDRRRGYAASEETLSQ